MFVGMLLIGNAGMQRRLYDPSVYEMFRAAAPAGTSRITHTGWILLFGAAPLRRTTSSSSLWRGAPRDGEPVGGRHARVDARQLAAVARTTSTSCRRCCTGRTSSIIRSSSTRIGWGRRSGCREIPSRDRRRAGARAHVVRRHGRVPRRLDDAVRGAPVRLGRRALTSPVWPPDGEPRAPLVYPAVATALIAASSWMLARGRIAATVMLGVALRRRAARRARRAVARGRDAVVGALRLDPVHLPRAARAARRRRAVGPGAGAGDASRAGGASGTSSAASGSSCSPRCTSPAAATSTSAAAPPTSSTAGRATARTATASGYSSLGLRPPPRDFTQAPVQVRPRGDRRAAARRRARAHHPPAGSTAPPCSRGISPTASSRRRAVHQDASRRAGRPSR